ncbi:hypothetical protein U9M48_029037 [Paspalum notatum var. saurae]|uniref:Uncharacterized protein n=1 Tax=Paspalum notatum var. saurae TaxID=547442 RepID=A0AAQ3X2C0_PASNO
MLACASIMPGHILLPPPKGKNWKSVPLKSTVFPSKRSGLKTSASSQYFGSLLIAQTFMTMSMPFGTSYPRILQDSWLAFGKSTHVAGCSRNVSLITSFKYLRAVDIIILLLQPQKHLEQVACICGGAVFGGHLSLPLTALVNGTIHQLEHLGVQRLELPHRDVNGAQEPRRREQVLGAELGALCHRLGQRRHELVPPPEPLAHDGAQHRVGHEPGHQLGDVDQPAVLAGCVVDGDGDGDGDGAARCAASSSRMERKDRTRLALRSSVVQILRSLRHMGPWGERTSPTLSPMVALKVAVMVLVAKLASCTLITSRAASADETTTACSSPSRMYMTGACQRRARTPKARCTSRGSFMVSRWWRLPITGSRHGPGGNLVAGAEPRGVRGLYRSMSTRAGRTTTSSMYKHQWTSSMAWHYEY